MRFILAVITVAGALVSISCSTAKSAAQNSESPVPATVGPIPGAVSAFVPRANPYTNDPVALQDGWRLFNWYNCSGCHGGHAGGGMGPSLRDPVWIYGDRDDQIFDSIAEGRANGMPSWASKIPEDQIWQLVAYIKSMGTPQEANPPVEPADEMVNESGPDTPPVAKAPQAP
jgi:cytochrome c oxidase cbb3-type subunit 3